MEYPAKKFSLLGKKGRKKKERRELEAAFYCHHFIQVTV